MRIFFQEQLQCFYFFNHIAGNKTVGYFVIPDKRIIINPSVKVFEHFFTVQNVELDVLAVILARPDAVKQVVVLPRQRFAYAGAYVPMSLPI